MIFSYHVHSVWSDGEAEIEDMIRSAGESGLSEVGISDHYVLSSDGGPVDWAMRPDALDSYVEAVQTASGTAMDGLVVRLGLEADFIPETTSNLRMALASQPFDFVIGSVHSVNGFPIDNTVDDWTPLNQAQRDEIICLYWVRVREMAESGLFDIAGHLDLYKKFGSYPSVDIEDAIDSALDAIVKEGMSVELNTAGWYKPCREEYPDPLILTRCFKKGIPVLVSADAHVPQDVVRGFGRGYALLRKIGYTDLASYAGRQMMMNPMPSLEGDILVCDEQMS